MKRITLLAILCAVAISMSFSQDFRKHSWGDSMAKVMAAEGEQEWMEVPMDDDFQTGVYFEGRIGGLDAGVGFFFVEDKLYSGKYLFFEEHANKNDFVNDFDHIDSNLQDKYGSTQVEEEWTEDNSWLYDRSDWGQQIYMGDLSIHTEWKIPQKNAVTLITHALIAEDFSFVHRLFYFSIELVDRVESLQKAENVF